MQKLIGQLAALGRVKLLALAGVGLALAGLLAFLAVRANTPAMAVLYSELDQRDAGAVVASLERQRVPVRLAAGGSQVLVPADQVARLRLSLAREGLPAGGAIGNEIFDRGESLTTTPFQQEMNRLRALEGELARSIRTLAGVRNARVHLVLPRREAFSRERAEAQASVLLTMQGAQRLDREGTQAVMHLVIAAVPGLRAQNVSIVDSRGELLARGGQAVGATAVAATQEELRRGHEVRLARGVEEMLERVLGQGRVRAEVAVEMDHDRVEIREERFDPENQVARSQQSSTESSRGAEPQNVSAGNNLPGAEAPPGGGGPQESRQEETTNFEIGRTLRNVLREAPVLKRVSVAVLVDGVSEAGEGGAPRVRERTPEELARIAALVRSAVGFNEARGDKVEVVSMRFAEPAMEPPAAGPLGLDIPQALLAKLMETAILAMVAVLALLLLGRPLVRKLALALVPQPALAGAADGAAPALASFAGAALLPGMPPPNWVPGQPIPQGFIPGPNGVPVVPPGAMYHVAQGQVLPGPPPGAPPALPGQVPAPAGPGGEEMVEMANVQGALSASMIQRVVKLVEANPDEALAVVRGWLAPEDDA